MLLVSANELISIKYMTKILQKTLVEWKARVVEVRRWGWGIKEPFHVRLDFRHRLLKHEKIGQEKLLMYKFAAYGSIQNKKYSHTY